MSNAVELKKGMMFSSRGKSYRITFRYIDDATVPAHPEESRGVLAFIQERVDSGEGKWKTLSEGSSRCSIQDRFVKDTGREKAFHRALKDLPSGELKEAAWWSYSITKRKSK